MESVKLNGPPKPSGRASIDPAIASVKRARLGTHSSVSTRKGCTMETTPLKALAKYFNTGENKKPLRDFSAEVKALSDDEKLELGTLAAEAMGDTIKA